MSPKAGSVKPRSPLESPRLPRGRRWSKAHVPHILCMRLGVHREQVLFSCGSAFTSST